jgi:hypothetical protein
VVGLAWQPTITKAIKNSEMEPNLSIMISIPFFTHFTLTTVYRFNRKGKDAGLFIQGLNIYHLSFRRVTTADKRLSNNFPHLIYKTISLFIFLGMLSHSLAILMTTYAQYIPGTQDEAARLMDDILAPIPIDLRDLG